MVKALNTTFLAERAGEDITTIYVESLTGVYKDLYNAVNGDEKTVLKAVEEGDGYIIATTTLTVGDNTTKEIVRVEEGAEPKILLNNSLYSIIEEKERAEAQAIAEKERAEAQAIADAKAEQQRIVAEHILSTLDVHVKDALAKAKDDFGKVIEKEDSVEETPAVVVEEVQQEKEAIVEEEAIVAEETTEQPEEDLIHAYQNHLKDTSKYIQAQILEDYDPEKHDANFQSDMVALKAELDKKIKAMFNTELNNFRRVAEMSSGGGGGGGMTKEQKEQLDINTGDIAELSASSTFSPLISSNHTAIEKLILSGTSGYDVTGAFAGKDPNAGAVWTSTGGINYTSDQALNDQVITFSLDPGIQGRTDGPYWSTPAPEEHVGVGLFGGAYLPNQPLAKSPIFAFSAVDNDTFEDGSNVVTTGRISLSGASYGDQLRVRFDLIVIPQVTNTTVTPMLWYKNATPAGVVTFSFELPTQPVFYGSGTVGKEHLMRVEISAWIANEEDVHALVYPAAKADNPCIFKPNSMMATIVR